MNGSNCPFCDTKPIETNYYVGCEKCNIYFDFDDEKSKQRAYIKWDTRAGEARYQFRIEKMCNALMEMRKQISSGCSEDALQNMTNELFSLHIGIKEIV
jgi:hypothetical protein